MSIAAVARMFEVTLESVGLTIQKYRVLAYLDQSPATPSELAYRLTVQAPTVTRLVAGLTERGYVAREVDRSDRRRNVLRVTGAGRRAIAQASTASQAALDRILAPLPARDRAAVERGLQLLGGAMLEYWRITHPGTKSDVLTFPSD
jgi:MarR family transcriptional regulator, lower aerobic nicotinate degradation pathway regulator